MASTKINKVVAVVVWYRPSDKEVESARTYYQDVARVIIVDNSDTDNTNLAACIPNADYLPLFANRGIAYALNRGCERAIALQADWVLTMDQDSLWKQNTVEEFIQEALCYSQIDNVGIFTPVHFCQGDRAPRLTGRFESRLAVMCSGNLLRLRAWQLANGFREDFFIDLVDDEMNCHLHQLNWQIIRLNNIQLDHHLGQGAHNLPLTKHPYTPHPAWRYYYIGRNLQRMVQLYPRYADYYSKHAWKELKRLCLYDWHQKGSKLYHFLKGWMEGLSPYANSWRLITTEDNHDFLAWLSQVPNQFEKEGEWIYQGRNQIKQMRLSNGEVVIVKRFPQPKGWKRIMYTWLRKPKAQRAYEYAQRLTSLSIPTPQALAYIIGGRSLLTQSYLITMKATEDRNFYEMREPLTPERKKVIQAFSKQVAAMHQKGVEHKDLSPGNILFSVRDEKIKITFIDINRMRFSQPLSLHRACRNMQRLWGHEDTMKCLSEAYAEAQNWDQQKVERLILHYWKRYWHIRHPHDIVRLFG